MEWINPHSWMHVEVKKPDGTVETWMIEAGSPNSLFRRGINKNTVKPGMVVVVDGYQARDGSRRANGRDVTLPEGRRLFLGSGGTGALTMPLQGQGRTAEVTAEAQDASSLRRTHDASRKWSFIFVLTAIVAVSVGFAACSAPASAPEAASASAAPAAPQEKGGQDEFGPYEPVANWPQPLPDGPDGVKHDGWTWGSVGAIYAETPDRIWIAQRGELPLAARARSHGRRMRLLTADARQRHGQRRRAERDVRSDRRSADGSGGGTTSVFIVDRDGKLVDEWPFMEKMFAQDKCGRGPHKIKMNPYDAEKHVWIIDDQQHVIWKFTHDGKLVMTLGTGASAGAMPASCSIGRPTSTGCPTARSSSATATAARASPSSTRTASSSRTGAAAEGSEQPRAERVRHRPQHRHQQGPAAVRRRSGAPAGSRSSTGTASSSTCSRRASTRRRTHYISTDQYCGWATEGRTGFSNATLTAITSTVGADAAVSRGSSTGRIS